MPIGPAPVEGLGGRPNGRRPGSPSDALIRLGDEEPSDPAVPPVRKGRAFPWLVPFDPVPAGAPPPAAPADAGVDLGRRGLEFTMRGEGGGQVRSADVM
jgi:hypothetical protein